jgi:peroxiredoxin
MNSSATRVIQVLFALVAVVVVWAFVGAARDGEHRRSPDALARLLAPNYSGNNRLAPDFDLTDQRGNHHHLQDYRGKVVVLHFWSRTCPPCIDELQREIPVFEELIRGRSDVVLLMVSVDAGWSAVEPLVPPGITSPMLFDPDRRVVARQYGTRQFPETWVIDPRGVIRARFDGTREWSTPLWIGYLNALL